MARSNRSDQELYVSNTLILQMLFQIHLRDQHMAFPHFSTGILSELQLPPLSPSLSSSSSSRGATLLSAPIKRNSHKTSPSPRRKRISRLSFFSTSSSASASHHPREKVSGVFQTHTRQHWRAGFRHQHQQISRRLAGGTAGWERGLGVYFTVFLWLFLFLLGGERRVDGLSGLLLLLY